MTGSIVTRGAILIVFVIGCVYAGNDFCVTKDGGKVIIGTQWLNEKNCSCLCMSVGDYTFSQCNDCSSVKNTKDKNSCVSNGLKYTNTDQWLSTVKECSVCQCTAQNKIICDSTKHCSNPCHDGQIAQFGPCCQVISCIGNATIEQQTQDCIIGGNIVKHGKSIVQRYHCKDKFCTCVNGHLECFQYCELSHNRSHQFWSKLCCPRRIGKKPCISTNGLTINPGQIQLLPDNRTICRCLDGEKYCSQERISITDIAEIRPTRSLQTTAISTSGLDVTNNTQLVEHIAKPILLISCISFFIVLLAILIAFLIRIQGINRRKENQRRQQHIRLIQNDTLEFYH